jgi:hypothetical protein
MATQYSMGHGMRRRSGVPSNPLEAAGTSMARSHMTSDEHHASASAAGSHRIAIGNSDPMPSFDMGQVDELNGGQYQGTLMPKKNTQAMDPTNPGSKANRVNMERIGATYRVQPKTTFVQLDPAAGPTMANARLIPSIQGRENPNFETGIETSY